jgi:hypothetical protein
MSQVRVEGWSGVENRKHRRVPLKVPIECRQVHEKREGQAENISVSGLLVRCERPFEQDGEISVSFTLPGGADPIHSQARVAHTVPGAFMGLEFLDLLEEYRGQIERYIATVPQSAGRPA